MNQITARVLPHKAVAEHHDALVRSLAGKRVLVNPETSTIVPGFGIRVEVIPVNKNKTAMTMLVNHLKIDETSLNLLRQKAMMSAV